MRVDEINNNSNRQRIKRKKEERIKEEDRESAVAENSTRSVKE